MEFEYLTKLGYKYILILVTLNIFVPSNQWETVFNWLIN